MDDTFTDAMAEKILTKQKFNFELTIKLNLN